MSLKDIEKELYERNPSFKKNKETITSKNVSPTNHVDNTDDKNHSDLSVVDLKTPWSSMDSAELSKDTISNKKERDTFTVFQKYSKIVIIFGISLLFVMTGFAGYYLYNFFNSKNITISTIAPKSVLVGQEFNIDINFKNTTDKALIDPIVSLSMPDGAIYVSNPSKKVVRKSVANASPGQIINESFKVAVIGGPSKTYRFNAFVSYGYGKNILSSRFERKTYANVLAGSSVLSINLSTAQKILSGEDFEISLKYQNISKDKIDNSKISFKLPDGFVVNGSDPALTDNSFSVQNLQPGIEKTAVISGSIIGQEYSFFPISAKADIKIGDKYYTINSKSNSVSILPSPLSIRLEIFGGSNPVYPGEKLSYKLIYVNNSGIALKDVVAKVKLSGKLIDPNKIKSDGFFNPSDNTITWTAANIPEFKNLPRDATGSIDFSIGLIKDYPIHRLSDKNFAITVDGQISSPTVPSGVISSKTSGITSISNNVGGRLGLEQNIYFKEPNKKFVNIGALPPSVGKPIEYSIHWKLESAGSDFENTKVSAFLGPGVEWTGNVLSNIKEKPTYDPRTKEVVWNIPKIFAGSGIVSDAPYVIFQVKVTPNETQVGNILKIISQGEVSSHDAFIGKDIQHIHKSLSSNNISDLSLPENYGKIRQ